MYLEVDFTDTLHMEKYEERGSKFVSQFLFYYYYVINQRQKETNKGIGLTKNQILEMEKDTQWGKIQNSPPG